MQFWHLLALARERFGFIQPKKVKGECSVFISQRIMHPHPGKSELALDRVHRMAGILSRHGAKTRIGRVTAGAGAGEIHLYAGFPTMAVGTAVPTAMVGNPA